MMCRHEPVKKMFDAEENHEMQVFDVMTTAAKMRREEQKEGKVKLDEKVDLLEMLKSPMTQYLPTTSSNGPKNKNPSLTAYSWNSFVRLLLFQATVEDLLVRYEHHPVVIPLSSIPSNTTLLFSSHQIPVPSFSPFT
ncbi:unnamed protein product [Caenorhabditis brenneri]